MTNLTRRQFGRLLLGGVAASLLEGCATAPPPAQSDIGPVVAATLVAPTPPSTRLLRNENVPGFYVRYYRPFEAVDPDRWTLSVQGLVQNPLEMSLAEVLALPRRTQVSRMKCVECWSAAAKWEGFHISTLIDMVRPSGSATWVYLQCADGYYESMSVEGLLRDRVLFAHHMNDRLLPEAYGAPLRLMVPFLYGYKSAKALVGIEFGDHEGEGYWSDRGYTSHGTIRAGFDHPLDVEGSREIQGGSEIFYPDGIEAGDEPKS